MLVALGSFVQAGPPEVQILILLPSLFEWAANLELAPTSNKRPS